MDKLDAVLDVLGIEKQTTEDRVIRTLHKVRSQLDMVKNPNLEYLIVAMTEHPKEASMILHEIERGSMETVITKFTGLVNPSSTKKASKSEESLAEKFPIPGDENDTDDEDDDESELEEDDDEFLSDDLNDDDLPDQDSDDPNHDSSNEGS